MSRVFVDARMVWHVDYRPADAALRVQLRGRLSESELLAFAQATATAVEATAGDAFRVLCDLRGMTPLRDDATEAFQNVKRMLAGCEGFRGLVVLTDSATVAMQQHRTPVTTTAPTVITHDPILADEFILTPIAE